MKIRVIAPFEIPGLAQDGMLEVPEGTRVKDLLKRSNFILRALKAYPMMVNGKQVKESYILLDGDNLIVVSPISGG